eukprot:Skav222822  [mRNA]  locus=scaffold4760:15102:27626:+ [translate_table: standard]
MRRIAAPLSLVETMQITSSLSLCQVAKEIEAKMLQHQRRFYEHLVRRRPAIQRRWFAVFSWWAICVIGWIFHANLTLNQENSGETSLLSWLICARYELSAEKKLRMPGGRAVTREAVAQAAMGSCCLVRGDPQRREMEPPAEAPTAKAEASAVVTKQADALKSQAKHRIWPIGRVSSEAEPQDQREGSDDSGCSDEEEERSAVDSDEEINEGEEIQLEDGEEERPNAKRLRSKTSPLVLLDFPEPSYEDYPKDAWPALWKGHAAPLPGEKGFNEYALSSISQVLKFWEDGNLRGSHQIYQQTPLACAHPLAPCKRLLVDARMGAGKTKVLISILDAHYEDGRKKLPIFPTRSLQCNFMDELLRWPSKYRSYFALMQPELAAKAVPLPANLSMKELREALRTHEDCEWKVPATQASELRRRLQTELEMTDVRRPGGQRICAVNRGHLTKTFRQWFQTTHPGMGHLLPGAPLRAMNLATAGGSFCSRKASGEARHPVAQFMYNVATQNCFDNSIVIVDEFHHLVTHFGSQKVKLLPRQLMTATNLTLVGLTGTPLPDNPKIPPQGLPAHLSEQRSNLEALLLGRDPKILRVLVTLSAFSGPPLRNLPCS